MVRGMFRPSTFSLFRLIMKRSLFAIRAMLCGLLLASAAHAQSLRIATAFDPQSMDPHALALQYHSRVIFQIYEFLINRDEQFKLEPALAVSWEMTNPTTWRFKLRPGVTFHDGTPFTADDAVFSIQRAINAPSQRAFQLKGVTAAAKVDNLTIDLKLEAPDAVLPEKLQFIAMMSKAWCEKHGVQRAQNFNDKQETFAARNTNGTGPFMLQRYEPDVRTTLRAFAGWWGLQDNSKDKRNGNLAEVAFITVKSDATRMAALSSGEIDMVLDPPFQDIARVQAEGKLALLQIDDIGQQYLAFDQARDELAGSSIKGRNPFRDLRVRQAVYHAIDINLIIDKVLRGQAKPTGAFLSTRVDGSLPELDKRLPFNPQKAKALLAQAGYPDGFSVTLDCLNVSWREGVCQAASAMLTRAGIRTTLRSMPTSQLSPRLMQADTSFIEFGWSPNPDAWASLNALFRSFDRSGLGSFNAGRYSNAKLDTLIDNIRVEPDATRRRAMVGVALRMIGEELPVVPLYRRKLTWVMNKKVSAVQWPNDQIELRWARVK